MASPGSALENNSLPNVPYLGAAAQQYAAQAKRVSFVSGNGVRMISQYAQFLGRITRDNSFFHYEGLTQDGEYFVTVLLPLTLPIKSSADNPSADGVVYPSDLSNTAALDAYFKGMTDLLDKVRPNTFLPDLALADAIAQSINITTFSASLTPSARDFIPELGTITGGELKYPAVALPALRIVFFNPDGSLAAYMDTEDGQNTFAMGMPDGTYTLVAYPLAGPDGIAGGFTKAVACGLSVDCTDHTLVPVTVKAGESVTGINPNDYYAPANFFPPMPK